MRQENLKGSAVSEDLFNRAIGSFSLAIRLRMISSSHLGGHAKEGAELLLPNKNQG